MTIFLQTERVLLKKMTLTDFPQINKLRSSFEVMRYSQSGVQSQEEIQAFMSTAIQYQARHEIGLCTAFEKESLDCIGQAGLIHIGFNDNQPEIEVAYRLHKNYWGRGFATELTSALIEWGLSNLPIIQIVAFVDPHNHPSRRVLEKCGMVSLGMVDSYYGKLEKYFIK